MGLFLVYMFKVSICLIFFYLFNRLFLSRETFHGVNRIVWLSVVAISLVLPLIGWKVDHSLVAPVVSNTFASIISLPINLQLPEEGVDLFLVVKYIFIAYLVFTTLFAIRLIGSYISLLDFILPKRREAKRIPVDIPYIELLEICKAEIGLDRKVHLVLHDSHMSPFSWMNNVVISRSDMSEAGKEILIHELAHIKYGHSWDIIILDILIIFQWFNPVVWLYKRSLSQIHEYMADKSVLDTGVNTRLYQLLLIKKTVDKYRSYSMISSLNQSKLKQRIVMMLQAKSNRWAVAKCLYLIPLASLSLLLFANPKISNHFNEISSAAAPFSYLVVDTLSNEDDYKVVDRGYNISQDGVNSPIKSFQTGRFMTGTNPLLIVDGLEYYYAKLATISKDEIESISVFKREDREVTALYGNRAKDGVVIVTLKGDKVNHVKDSEYISTDIIKPVVVFASDTEQPALSDNKRDLVDEGYYTKTSIDGKSFSVRMPGLHDEYNTPIVLVDGKEISNNAFRSISPRDIESVSILKDKISIDIYGEKAKYGAVLITLKDPLVS